MRSGELETADTQMDAEEKNSTDLRPVSANRTLDCLARGSKMHEVCTHKRGGKNLRYPLVRHFQYRQDRRTRSNLRASVASAR